LGGQLGLVRLVHPRDLGALAEIHAHWVTGSHVTFETQPWDAERWMGALDDARRAGHPWWVVEGSGGVDGYLRTGPFRPAPAYRPTVESSVYLRPAAMARGLGRRLYETGLPALAEAGFANALALIALPNAASVALHERVGFRGVGELDRVGNKLDGWWSVGIYQRALGVPR